MDADKLNILILFIFIAIVNILVLVRLISEISYGKDTLQEVLKNPKRFTVDGILSIRNIVVLGILFVFFCFLLFSIGKNLFGS